MTSCRAPMESTSTSRSRSESAVKSPRTRDPKATTRLMDATCEAPVATLSSAAFSAAVPSLSAVATAKAYHSANPARTTRCTLRSPCLGSGSRPNAGATFHADPPRRHSPRFLPRMPATDPPGASPATSCFTRSRVSATFPFFSAAVIVAEYAAQTSAAVIS